MIGLILYTDGGAKDNPGPAGSGVHGYLFSDETPKKGTGNTKDYCTQKGYVKKEDYEKAHKNKVVENPPLNEMWEDETPYRVEILHYIDAWEAHSGNRSNNYAELQAVKLALTARDDLNIDYDIDYIRIISDSEYVVKGINQYLEKWVKNGYKRSDGTEIANVSEWKHINTRLNDYVYKDGSHGLLNVTVEWIKGHADHLGNEKADRLATIACGIAEASFGTTGGSIHWEISPAQGYWANSLNKIDLLFNRYVLFNPAACKDEISDVYFTANTSEPLNYLGSMQGDAGFALVKLNNQSHSNAMSLLSDVIKVQSAQLLHSPLIVAADTNVLMTADTYNDYKIAGIKAFPLSTDYKRELMTADRVSKREPICNVINPAYTSFRVFELLESMHDVHNSYMAQEKGIVTTDITDVFYEKDDKDKSVLKPEFVVGYKKESVDVRYCVEGDELALCNVILVLGRDIPDRNTLKRLETYNPRVLVITKQESPHVFRYFTLLECDEGWTLTGGLYSNTRIVSQKDLLKYKSVSESLNQPNVEVTS